MHKKVIIMNSGKYMYVGTLFGKGSLSGKGQGVYCLDITDGTIQEKGFVKGNSLSYVCKGRNGVLYGVSEVKDFTGLNGSGGGVVALKTNPDGSLTMLNSSISYGSRPCHLTVSQSGRYLLVANHGSHTTVTCSYRKKEDGSYTLERGFDASSIAVFSIEKDGRIGKLCDLYEMKGKGYWCHGGGQSTSHIHCVIERNGLVIGCNRGTDEIVVCRLDEETGRLSLLQTYETPAGYAPRMTVFHPFLPLFYVVFENYPAIGMFQIRQDGTVIMEQMTGTMEQAFYRVHPLPVFEKRHAYIHEVNTCAMMNHDLPMASDLHVSSDGRLLYVSNRLYGGKGSLSLFHIDSSGDMHLTQVKPLPGADIRGFGIDEENRWIAAGIMDADMLVLIRYDEDGRLQEPFAQYTLQSPSCIIF